MFKTIRDFNIKEKRVLVRCDFNVSFSKQRNVLDDFRLKQTLPTIEYLIKNKAKIILISHLGRPKNKEIKYSLKPVAQRLEELLGRNIKFLDDCIGKKVEKEIGKMKVGEIILLENLRFYQEEKENDKNFAKKLAELGDIFIQEAFAVCHRNHASVVGIPEYLNSGIGFLLENELKTLSQIIKKSKRPLLIIIGGSKIKNKASAAGKLFKIADFLLLGNLVAQEVKKTKLKNSLKIIFPVDNKENCDIGEKTIELFREKIGIARTIFWVGPLGKIEEKKYQNGTKEIAKKIIESKAYSIVGGGDTIAFLGQYNIRDKFNFISTGGGAMLDYIADGKLVGIEALRSGR